MAAPEGLQSAGSFCVPASHPALPGHFPADPVVPGVVLLDHTAAIVLQGAPRATVQALRGVKFFAPVRAGQEIDVFCTRADTSIAFSCLRAGQTILSGTMVVGSVDP